jgi:hypothetical protein
MQALLVMFALCAAVVYWKATLAILGAVVAYWWYHYHQAQKAAQRAAEAARIATLIEHADRQHRLVQRGDMAGIYGSYPVPDDCRGLRIWLCGSEQPLALSRARLRNVAG